VLKELVRGRAAQEAVFLNRLNQPLTRFGIYELVQRAVAQADTKLPILKNKRISPHSIRHYLPSLTMSGSSATAACSRVNSWLSQDIVLDSFQQPQDGARSPP